MTSPARAVSGNSRSMDKSWYREACALRRHGAPHAVIAEKLGKTRTQVSGLFARIDNGIIDEPE